MCRLEQKGSCNQIYLIEETEFLHLRHQQWGGGFGGEVPGKLPCLAMYVVVACNKNDPKSSCPELIFATSGKLSRWLLMGM